jgi:DNA-binding transcriptional regulator YiaG
MTSTEAGRPVRYSIKALLGNGAQPWENFGADEMRTFDRGFEEESQIRLIPVILTSDGILIDGHQRLRLLLKKGHTYISAADVRVDETATAENAIERAITLNANRRDTTEKKAALARQLRAERGWSQGQIARLFGVSRPAVSQWFAKTAGQDTGDGPPVIIGKDGRAYDREAVSGRPATRPQRSPWHPDGYAFKAVRKALTVLQSEPYGALPPLQEARTAQLLADLIEAAEALQNTITEA